ncbi:SHOCT domain-containing protein [Clostridium chromiireducens]|uniref:SHOCT domain-containing protein n=1 Tax=Clostridium chromiireducens TaxID=225345 RepID=UPI003AF43471
MVMAPILILSIIGISVVSINFYIDSSKRKKEEELEQRIHRHNEANRIPSEASLLHCISMVVDKKEINGSWDVSLWKDKNNLNFCGTYDCISVRKLKIPIENIQFYTREGDCRVETITEGGDISIGNAIVGGIIGFIIGIVVGFFIGGVISAFVGLIAGVFFTGKGKITTSSKEIDNRRTCLNYLENNENKRMVFTSKGYDEFLKLVPQKELKYIENNKIVESDKTQGNNDNVYKDIERLAELKDKGILTEDEFKHKKQLLLDKI